MASSSGPLWHATKDSISSAKGMMVSIIVGRTLNENITVSIEIGRTLKLGTIVSIKETINVLMLEGPVKRVN